MAALTATNHPKYPLFNEKVTATPAFNGDRRNNYDSTLIREEQGVALNQNDILRIELRLFFRQINPNAVTLPMMTVIARAKGLLAPGSGSAGMHPDWNKTPRWIKPWSDAEWNTFIASVKNEAKLWNKKFWLVPPDGFKHFDKTQARSTNVGLLGTTVQDTFRPTIECEFSLRLVPSSEMAHASIDAVNILGAEIFRADNMTYRSTMTTPTRHEGTDWRSRVVRTVQPTIAHEIGHSLGLPHIGTSRSLPNCRLAIDWQAIYHQDSLPLIMRDGEGSDVCYGEQGAPGDINNIMGMGNSFDAENAAPWLSRLLEHLNLTQQDRIAAVGSLNKWRVSTTPTVPKKIA